MKLKSGELESTEVSEHLFKDESRFQSQRIYVYSGLFAFTVLLVITFLVLNAGLAFALTCGVSIGISFSMLILSVMRIGTKTFWVYFAWSLGVLLGFAYFGMPKAIIQGLESIGITHELMIVGSLFQVALFFVYVAHQQCKDFKRSVLELESNDLKLEKGFVQKKTITKKPKKKGKLSLRKRFSVRMKRIANLREESSEPKVFQYYRYVATYICLVVTALLSISVLLYDGIGAFLAYSFFAMFCLTLSLLLIQMIKPGSKRFWIAAGAFTAIVVPVFWVLTKS